MKFTMAVGQVDAAVGDLEKNIRRHVEMTREAIARKAALILFPELSLTGYSVRDLNWDLAINLNHPQVLRPLLTLSRSITIVAGGVEEGSDFGIYNSAFVFEEGQVTSAHRKIYPPTYGMFEEMRYFAPGKSVRPFRSKHGNLGILICEDLWHLPLPYLLARQGAGIILGLAASPTRLAGSGPQLQNAEVNTEHHKTYARLLSTYVAFANRVGIEDGVSFWGGSSIIDPSGSTLASAKLFEEDLLIGEIDEQAIRRARRFSRHFVDDSVSLTLRELTRIERENPS